MWDKLLNSILLLGVVVTRLPILLHLVSVFSFGLFITGFHNITRIKKYDGLMYRLDEAGLVYFENNKYHLKKMD